MLSFDRIKSLLGKLHKSVANFSTSPFCCNASHKHCTWSGLKSNCFRPKSILSTLLTCPITAEPFGDIPYGCERFSFSRFAIGSIEWWSRNRNGTIHKCNANATQSNRTNFPTIFLPKSESIDFRVAYIFSWFVNVCSFSEKNKVLHEILSLLRNAIEEKAEKT